MRYLFLLAALGLGACIVQGELDVSISGKDVGIDRGLDSATLPDGRLSETDGRLPETDGRLPETDGRLPENDGRLPENDGRLPENDAPTDPPLITLQIDHAPQSPHELEAVTFTVLSNTEVALAAIEIWVDSIRIHTCQDATACVFKAPPFALGEHDYHAVGVAGAEATSGVSTSPAAFTVTASGVVFDCGAEAGSPVLPQFADYQATLRNYMACFSESDFDIDRSPFTYEPAFLGHVDEVTRAWLVMENRGYTFPNPVGFLTHSQYFTLQSIESIAGIKMTVGRGQFFDPIGASFWIEWDYPGNPQFQSTALQRRLFVASAVYLMMWHKDLAAGSGTRSDFTGGALLMAGKAYHAFKHVVPHSVRQAYLSGLKEIFDRNDGYTPHGQGGGDMEFFQIPGIYYTAQALEEGGHAGSMERARARAHYVLEELIQPGGLEHHGAKSGIDGSYSGLGLYFLSWGALLFKDAVIDRALEGVARAQAYMSLREPDALFLSPTHFNCCTGYGLANDQWAPHFKDWAVSMRTDEALFRIKTRSDILDESQMRAYIATHLPQRSPTLVTPLASEPGPWSRIHWIEHINHAATHYEPGFYARLIALQQQDAELFSAPYQRSEDFIIDLNDGGRFLVFRLGGFGGVLYTGTLFHEWSGRLAGFGGGNLSSFWTPSTGSAILGRAFGTQNNAPGGAIYPDVWSNARNWAVHAITGYDQSGAPFSSARQRSPVAVYDINAHQTSATVTVSGVLSDPNASCTDAMRCPAANTSLQGSVHYERVFRVDARGVHVTSTLTSDGTDSVSELFDVIPIQLKHPDNQEPNARVELSTNGGASYGPLTQGWTSGVTHLRIDRFGGSVTVSFDNARRIRPGSLWPNPALPFADRATAGVLPIHIDLLTQPGSMPTSTSVGYLIR
ncbi:MAG: hypothetical protein H0U74_10620 [Bradymonadaceae bacterium]|nr:hypothetical protein [Lujinxingiaceae bacterium]